LIEQVIEWLHDMTIRVITKLPNSEQSYKGKVKTHKYMHRQNQSTTGKLTPNVMLLDVSVSTNNAALQQMITTIRSLDKILS
jgi:hypothetical protein